jgi:anthranilate synthase component 1
VEGADAIARHTFLGAGPVARLTARGSGVEEERKGKRTVAEGGFLEALGRLAVREDYDPDPELPPLAAGAVGYLSYDAVRLFEQIPDRHPREGRIPDASFLLFDAVVAFDHLRGRLLLLTVVDGRDAARLDRETDEAIERLDRLEGWLRENEGGEEDRDDRSPLTPALSQGERGRKALSSRSEVSSEFSPAMPRERFLEAVGCAKEAILAGEVYQVVLSQRWTGALDLDPFDVYRALRRINPSPYLFYLQTREAVVLGASPEMLVRCRGRLAETRPIAGTAPRGGTPEEDGALARALLADPKERAEHVMLVDLARNDLGRCCEIGSVSVTRYAEVEKYSHVQHLVSEVHGRLAPGRFSADALAACFPAGTLTGAPKIRAMELIDELETCRRGIYGGAVGYLASGGDLDLSIAIRMAVVEDGLWRIQAGAGIVADSSPEREYAEAESKARALFRAIEVAGNGDVKRKT